MDARFHLSVVRGPDAGRSCDITGAGATIGRQAGNDLVLTDREVSRRHARLDLRDGRVVATDLESSAGTLVNGRRIDAPQPLAPGDTLQLGATHILLGAGASRDDGATRTVLAGDPAAAQLDTVVPHADAADAAAAHALPAAATLDRTPIGEGSVLGGRYRLDRLVGLGGFARVFLATDLTLKRLVALKVLNADLTEDEDFLGRFAREAQAVAALDHPHILGIHDYGQVGATAYLVMPYVDGGSLHDRLRAAGPPPLPQAAEWLRQAAAALDYAHRRSLVHRDVKPQNMLLRDDGERLLLTDFGIAKVLSATSAQSKTGVMGTLSYMAPEQFRGEVGRATDIYALGCVAFQLVSGQLPFTGPTEQVMYGHLAGAIPSLAERARGQVPPQLQAIIVRALAKDPAERHHSAGDLARDFAAALADAGAASPPVAAPPRPADTPAAPTPPARHEAPTVVPATPPEPSAPEITGGPPVEVLMRGRNSPPPAPANHDAPTLLESAPAVPGRSDAPTVVPTMPSAPFAPPARPDAPMPTLRAEPPPGAAREAEEREQRHAALYAQAQRTIVAGSTEATIRVLEELTSEAPGYRDAATLLARARHEQGGGASIGPARAERAARPPAPALTTGRVLFALSFGLGVTAMATIAFALTFVATNWSFINLVLREDLMQSWIKIFLQRATRYSGNFLPFIAAGVIAIPIIWDVSPGRRRIIALWLIGGAVVYGVVICLAAIVLSGFVFPVAAVPLVAALGFLLYRRWNRQDVPATR